jgi:hypothetical protein
MRRAVRIGIVTIAVIVLLGLVIVSPLALKELGLLHGMNWFQLSSIGQTYGAASALLTGLALIGVVGSMIYQARAIQSTVEQSSREHHFRLVEMAMNDPLYQLAWGSELAIRLGDRDTYRQQVYVNLIISYWERDYIQGDVPEHALRIYLTSFFGGEAGRTWWAKVRNLRLIAAKNRKARRFVKIVDQEYRKAVRSGPATVPAMPPTDVKSKPGKIDNRIRAGVIIASAAAGGAVIATAIRHLLGAE